MRKLLMTIGAAALLAGSAQAADNYTCATPPSCATLGYTLTSTSNCIGAVLRCPFDTSRLYCTTKTEALNTLKQEIVTAAMPDYSRRQSRSLGSTYTASTNGYLIGVDYYNQTDSGGSFNIYINGVDVRLDSHQFRWARNNWTYPVQKGASYRVSISGGNSSATYYFVPTI